MPKIAADAAFLPVNKIDDTKKASPKSSAPVASPLSNRNAPSAASHRAHSPGAASHRASAPSAKSPRSPTKAPTKAKSSSASSGSLAPKGAAPSAASPIDSSIVAPPASVPQPAKGFAPPIEEESLVDSIKQKVGGREEWRDRHVGSSGNMQAARSASLHAELQNPSKPVGPRVKYPSTHFSPLAVAYEERAMGLENQVPLLGDDLPSRIGMGLYELGKVKDGQTAVKMNAKSEIYLEWDKNKDGRLNIPEWRQQIRKIPTCQNIHVKEVDALFESFDSDRSGFIEMKELNAAFNEWLDAANDVKKTAESISKRASSLRDVAHDLRRAARQTAELEAQESKLAVMKTSDPTLGSRIGRALMARNMKAALAAQQWDTSGDGQIDKFEFRHHIRRLGRGLQAVADEPLDELFDGLDIDKSGVLDMTELKSLMARLQEEAAKSQRELEDELVLIKAMVTPVTKAQKEALMAVKNAEPLPATSYDRDEAASPTGVS